MAHVQEIPPAPWCAGQPSGGCSYEAAGEMTDPLVAVGQQFLDVLKAIEELANALREGAPDQPVHGAILLQQFFEIAEQIAAARRLPPPARSLRFNSSARCWCIRVGRTNSRG